VRKTISIIAGLAIVLWLGVSASAVAQKIVLQSLAHGKGTLVLADDQHKLTEVLIILKENGDAEFTLFTEMQLSAQGRWTAGKDPSQGIDLKITGGVVKGDTKGTGKLFLRADGKSVASLTAQGANDDGEKFDLNFVADDKNQAQP
jgi:hypothetical protein